MSALISASAVPVRCDMTLAPHELPIHALRTNEALPIRHGISDFLKAPAAVHPARCNCYGRSRPMRRMSCSYDGPSLKRPGRFRPVPVINERTMDDWIEPDAATPDNRDERLNHALS